MRDATASSTVCVPRLFVQAHCRASIPRGRGTWIDQVVANVDAPTTSGAGAPAIWEAARA